MKRLFAPLLAAGLLSLCLISAPADARAEPDYGALLTQDATALRDAFLDSHPGPVDPLNPGFRKRLDAAYARAMDRARSAHTYGGYWWAMREFIASFDDGHVGIGTTDKSPPLKAAWPGFLTRFDGGRQVVATRLDEAAAPALGAELVSCDGRPAARLAEDNVGHFRGRWFLASQRAQHGARLFLDVENPWIKRPQTCIFAEGGHRRTYALRWRPLSDDDVGKRLSDASAAYRAPIESHAFGDGAVWISAGSFNGDPASDASRQLTALVAGLKADLPRLRAARIIVLDVRGNGGGSSEWPRKLGGLVWGESWVTAHSKDDSQVDWRVSDANIDTLAGFGEALRRQPQPDKETLYWVDLIVKGLKDAKAKGLPLWRQTDPGAEADAPSAGPAAAVADAARPLTAARVYVLTDPACASACLDGVDLWKAAGAVQVGRETSADTNYMEIRDQALPSGLTTLSLPMKVYRGRPRGPNEPQRPAHVFPGRMDDTPALERWILGLPGR
jgi:hypothetical protein